MAECSIGYISLAWAVYLFSILMFFYSQAHLNPLLLNQILNNMFMFGSKELGPWLHSQFRLTLSTTLIYFEVQVKLKKKNIKDVVLRGRANVCMASCVYIVNVIRSLQRCTLNYLLFNYIFGQSVYHHWKFSFVCQSLKTWFSAGLWLCCV